MKFRFAPGLQPRIHFSAGMVPAEQLLTGCIVPAGIQISEEI